MESGKLFVGGISWDTNEDRLREYFQTFGEVVEAVIMKDRATGRARGFGFVIYADPAVVERVVRQKHMIDGRAVEAKKAVPSDDHHIVSRIHNSPISSAVPTRTKKIFVGGLAFTVTEADFKSYFDQFGTITDVVVMYDHNTQRPRGFGFITFNSEEAVEKALIRNFHELNGKVAEVKRAVPREMSPGPSRSPLVGGSSGLGRVNSLLNGYAQGYNPSPIGGHMSFARNGFPTFNPSGYGPTFSFEPRMSPSYGENASFFPKISFEQGLSSLHPSNINRLQDSFAEYDGVSRDSGSTLGSSWSLWGNGSVNDSFYSGNTGSMGFRVGDIEAVGFKNGEAIWNPSPVPVQASGHSSLLNGLGLNYSREEINHGSAVGLYDRELRARAPAPSSFTTIDGGYDAKFDYFDVEGSEQQWPLALWE